jgi:GNAT superfamily N-acetyltransferase
MKLLDTITKDNNSIEVWSGQLSFSPVFSLVLRTYAEIVEKNLAPARLDLNNTDSVVWAQRTDGTILGGICYKFEKDYNSVYIELSFTAENSRGLGINSICHHYVEQDAKNLGYTAVMSTVHINNKARLNSAEKVGLNPLYYIMHKKLINVLDSTLG